MATLKERRELIESLKIPGRRTATLRQDADAWLRNWRNERGINPNSGVIPNDPAEAPAHLRFIIFGRRASATPLRDSLKAEIPNWSTGGGLDKTAKDRLNRPEFEKDVIQGVKDGSIPPEKAPEILQISDEEWHNLFNQLTESLKIKPEGPAKRKY